MPAASLHRSLAHLQTAEFLYETRLFPESEYTFKHALTHEVAYGSVLQERRRVLHARIVEALEALAGDRVAEQAERLAQHALRGEVWDKALAYCRQAGEKAMARSTYHEAVGYFEQALRALPHLPEQRALREQAIDLRLALRSALFPSGDAERILVYLREAEALAAALDDPRRLGQIAGFLSVHFRNRGAYDQAIAAARRALALATTSEEGVLHALAHQRLGLAYQSQGDYQRAIDCLRRSVVSLRGAQRQERLGQANVPAVQSLAYLATCYGELGLFAEGRRDGEEGLQLAETVAAPQQPDVGLVWHRARVPLPGRPAQGPAPAGTGPGHLSGRRPSGSLCPGWLRPWGPRILLAGRVADAVALLTPVLEQTRASGPDRLSGALLSSPGRSAAAGRARGGGARPRRADAGAHPGAPGTGQPGLCPAAPRRDCSAA